MSELRSSGRGQREGTRSRSRSPISRSEQILYRRDINDVDKNEYNTVIEAKNQEMVTLPTSKDIPDIEVLRATFQKLEDRVNQAENNARESKGLSWEKKRLKDLNDAENAKDKFYKFMYKYDDPLDNSIIKERARDNWDQWEKILGKGENDPDYKTATTIAEALNEASAEWEAKRREMSQQEQPLQDVRGETRTSQVESADTTKSTDLSTLTDRQLKKLIRKDINAAMASQAIAKWPHLQGFKDRKQLYCDQSFPLYAFGKDNQVYITDNMSILGEKVLKMRSWTIFNQRAGVSNYGIEAFKTIEEAYRHGMSNNGKNIEYKFYHLGDYQPIEYSGEETEKTPQGVYVFTDARDFVTKHCDQGKAETKQLDAYIRGRRKNPPDHWKMLDG